MTAPEVLLLGAGGHGVVVLALARALGWQVAGVCDPALSPGTTWEGLPVLDEDTALSARDPGATQLLNGLGKMPGSAARAALQARWTARGFAFPALVHPAAWVAPGTDLAPGAQVMAGAVVQPRCRIGAGAIVNTGARLDHDGTLGDDVHLAPGATLCGGVTVGEGAFIGAGATVIQGLTIGPRALVPAGATVLHDIPPGGRAPRPAERPAR